MARVEGIPGRTVSRCNSKSAVMGGCQRLEHVTRENTDDAANVKAFVSFMGKQARSVTCRTFLLEREKGTFYAFNLIHLAPSPLSSLLQPSSAQQQQQQQPAYHFDHPNVIMGYLALFFFLSPVLLPLTAHFKLAKLLNCDDDAMHRTSLQPLIYFAG